MRDEFLKKGKSERPKESNKSEGYCVLSLFHLYELIYLRVIEFEILIQFCELVLTVKVSGELKE